MVWSLLALLLCLSPGPARANPAGTADNERILRETKAALLSGTRFTLLPGLAGPRRSRLTLDAIEELLAAGHPIELASVIPDYAWPALEPQQRVRWFRLGGIAHEEDLVSSLTDAPADPGFLYELLRLEPELRTPGAAVLLRHLENALPAETRAFRAAKLAAWTPPTPAAVRSLFNDPVDSAHFQGGAYAAKPRLFLFCRHDRNYPCLLTLKDKDDHPVRSGSALWTQPGLGLSGYGKPFNEHLGNTPQGVHLVDSVMPDTEDVVSFGRFRRMILEFPAASPAEVEMHRLLPAGALGTDWWQESAIARDAGRGELRIHGTGEHNDQPDVLFYPFIATIGCVAQRELSYAGVDYIDQRHLLDQVMHAQGLAPTFDNEPALRALLYVIDIDQRTGAVTAADLARLGIQ